MDKQLEIAIKAIAAQNPPGWQRPLSAYSKFDWEAIGATVVQNDAHGPTWVAWMGHIYTRRSGGGKFGAAIWYSRSGGKKEDGEASYLRLITFKDLAIAEPLPEDVVRRIK